LVVRLITLAGNKLTFKATAFEARKDATYRVKIKAALGTRISFFDWTLLPQTTEKTLTVTVTKNPDDNGKYVPTFRITTANVSTPENTRLGNPVDDGFFSRLGK
jgi:hypothetical protein